MATCLTVPNLRTGYVDVAKEIMRRGKLVAPRGQKTRELLDVTIEVLDPTDTLPIGVGRKLNPAIAAAESLQLIGGVSRPELMTNISMNFANFLDGDRFWGAYGDRVRRMDRGGLHQAQIVVDRLRADPDSRQAVIALWRPEFDLVEGKKDYPCTLSLMFTIRDGRLQLHTTMRSNDLWWGLAYDAFQFAQLQLTVAHSLGVRAGSYVHHAISLHIYERDWENVEALHYPTSASKPDVPDGIRFLNAESTPWHALELQAQFILDKNTTGAGAMQHPWWYDQIGRP